tara:strand:+ start:26615 stop:27295 length:681 start_codon:yes stop_codon:yes gene_type:complete
MGTLPNDTNNIIVDAVLTDLGRTFLAQQDGSFSITMFGLGDAEVDYTMIKKFGRTVGKEKVEKNCFVMEALTNSDTAMPHMLVSTSRRTLDKMPGLSLSTNTVNLDMLTNTSKKIDIEQSLGGGASVTRELKDSMYKVVVPSHMQLKGKMARSVDIKGNQTYYISADTSLSNGGSGLSLDIEPKPGLSTETFQKMGNKSNAIKTDITVSGMQSGATSILKTSVTQT